MVGLHHHVRDVVEVHVLHQHGTNAVVRRRSAAARRTRRFPSPQVHGRRVSRLPVDDEVHISVPVEVACINRPGSVGKRHRAHHLEADQRSATAHGPRIRDYVQQLVGAVLYQQLRQPALLEWHRRDIRQVAWNPHDAVRQPEIHAAAIALRRICARSVERAARALFKRSATVVNAEIRRRRARRCQRKCEVQVAIAVEVAQRRHHIRNASELDRIPIRARSAEAPPDGPNQFHAGNDGRIASAPHGRIDVQKVRSRRPGLERPRQEAGDSPVGGQHLGHALKLLDLQDLRGAYTGDHAQKA